MTNYKNQFKKIISQCSKCGEKATLALAIFLIAGVLIFLYNYVYLTMSDAGELIKLKGQVALEVVDMEKWNKINKEIEWKKQPLGEGGLERNPFE